MSTSREKLIAELDRLARVFEGHPEHVGVSKTLANAIGTIMGLEFALTLAKGGNVTQALNSITSIAALKEGKAND